MNDETVRLQRIAQKLVDADVICRAWEFEWYIENLSKIPDEIKEVNDEEIWEALMDEDSCAEVFEWYKVTGFLASDLKEKGEVIIEAFNSFYWGRTCTGQSVILDWVIQEIAQMYYKD